MSVNRSYGSNYHPSSQTRKISIGIFADSQPKRNPGDGDVIARVENLNKKDKVDLPAKGTEHVTSPWRSPKSSYGKLGTLEKVLTKQTSSLSASKGLLNKGGLNGGPVRDSFLNIPISSPQQSNCELNRGRNDISPERVEEPPSPILQDRVASQREGMMDKPEKDKTVPGTTEVLRSKLWEILGKGSSANDDDVSCETPEAVETNLKMSQNKGSNDNPLITKPRHNSDTIETDSESPEISTRRPVTRSLLQRKKVGVKGVQKKTAKLSGKRAEQVNNVFSFEEGLRGKIGTAMDSTVKPKKQRGRKKNTVVKSLKVNGMEKETSKSKTPARSERTESGKRSSTSSDKKESSHELYQQQSKARKLKPDVSTREEATFHPSPEAEKTTSPEMFHGDKHEKSSNVFREKSVEPEYDFQSPTFGYKGLRPSPSVSPEEASPLQPRNISPAFDDETETPIFSFGVKKTSQDTKGKVSDTKMLNDFLEKKGDYSFRRESSPEPNEDGDIVLSDPSSDERDSDGSKENSPELGKYKNSPEEKETTKWKSNVKTKLRSSSAKRNSNRKGNKRVVMSPNSEIHETGTFQQSSEMDEDDDDDDGLGRAVALFAVALQNYEKKLNSAAKKKSSEIIASVSEEIHLELENVKSHIVTEAGKASNVAKTKRKHTETILQEQQEKMRMIHEKFKDDVGHHLEEFKNTIEGLEADHSELKGTIKKQRTTHQKLIAHFEGGIETKLDNATKRINSVNESARGKMMQLKMIVAECLKD